MSIGTFLDPIYGPISFSHAIDDLIRRPLVQRLREIRLSNIDSLTMPGVACISRYEHSLGAAHLASQIGFIRLLGSDERCALEAAALLHDSAIQPFGHLVEEALEYVDVTASHEERWSMLAAGEDQSHVGGIDLQIYMGRQSGLYAWSEATFGVKAKEHMAEIISAIHGGGRWGKSICSDVDIDNLDNVTRAAYHMGIEVDRSLPVRIAERMVDSNSDSVVFTPDAVNHIYEWLQLRSKVYQQFMLSKPDFIGKTMLIYAATQAFKKGELTSREWTLTDRTFLDRLLDSKHSDVSDTIKRWLCQDLWSLSDLLWMQGRAPTYQEVHRFSETVASTMGRHCFAYRIKDKMTRAVSLRITSGESMQIGSPSSRWLLGVGSRMKKEFTRDENKRVAAIAAEFFQCKCLGSIVDASKEQHTESLPLFQKV